MDFDLVTYKLAQRNGGGTTPTKGFVPTSWDSDGFVLTGDFYGDGTIPNYGFYSANTDVANGVMCNNRLTAINFKGNITSIGDHAFQYCRNLASLTLPDTVTSFGSSSFEACNALSSINLPSGVTQIPEYCFKECKALLSIVFPDSITRISDNAFFEAGLTSVVFKGKPDDLRSSAFGSCANLLDIYVPWAEGAVEGAPWGATNATIHYNSTGV